MQPIAVGGHQAGVAQGVGEHGQALVGSDEFDREGVRVGAAQLGELGLHPVEQGPHHLRRGPVQAVVALVELGREGSEGAAEAGGGLTLIDPAGDERLQPGGRVREGVQAVGEGVELRAVVVHRGFDQLVLGLEVVIDVAERHLGRTGDVAEGGLLHALLMEDLDSRPHQALTFAAPAGTPGERGPARGRGF